MFNKKSISPVVATALLIVVCVFAVVSFQSWFGSYSSKIYVDTEQKSKSENSVEVLQIVGDKLFIKNLGSQNISSYTLRIDNISCVVGNLSVGLNSYDISSCLDNLTTNTPDITLITDNYVSSKKEFIKGVVVNSVYYPPGDPITDPYWDNVVLLLHMDDGHGSTTFIDQKGHSVTSQYSAAQTNTQVMFGNSSVYLNSPSNRYLHVPHHIDYNFGTGDFTIETWVYTVSDVRNTLITKRDSWSTTSGAWGIMLFDDCLYWTDEVNGVASKYVEVNIPINNWNHIAVSRNSGVLKIFVNGIQYYSQSNTYSYTNSQPIRIGYWDAVQLGDFTGYIDDFRITNGVGRYTGNFTIRSSAFPNTN